MGTAAQAGGIYEFAILHFFAQDSIDDDYVIHTNAHIHSISFTFILSWKLSFFQSILGALKKNLRAEKKFENAQHSTKD